MARACVTTDTCRPNRLSDVLDVIRADEGLQENVSPEDLLAGLAAADALNRLILRGLREIDAFQDKQIDAKEVSQVNAWIRANSILENRFLRWHGDDEGGVETGFHKIQNDGASTLYHGLNFVDTVVDGIYHIGFEIKDGHFLNEDGDQNASVEDVADWLTDLSFNDYDLLVS